jgi:hypothetical protein
MEPLFRFREKQRIINALERLRWLKRQPLPPPKEGWEHFPPHVKQADKLIELYERRLRELK